MGASTTNNNPALSFTIDFQEYHWSDDELACFVWLCKIAMSNNDLPQGHCVHRIYTSGGDFSKQDINSIDQSIGKLKNNLDRELEVWKPKYFENVCLGSKEGFELISRLGYHYRNLNVESKSIYSKGRKLKTEKSPNRLLDILPMQSMFKSLESVIKLASDKSNMTVKVRETYEYF